MNNWLELVHAITGRPVPYLWPQSSNLETFTQHPSRERDKQRAQETGPIAHPYHQVDQVEDFRNGRNGLVFRESSQHPGVAHLGAASDVFLVFSR